MRVDPNCILGTHECTGYTFDDLTDRYVRCGCDVCRHHAGRGAAANGTDKE